MCVCGGGELWGVVVVVVVGECRKTLRLFKIFLSFPILHLSELWKETYHLPTR